MSAQSLLRADGISHAYGDRTVFTDLTFSASGGQRTGLLGENGAGKSTCSGCSPGGSSPIGA